MTEDQVNKYEKVNKKLSLCKCPEGSYITGITYSFLNEEEKLLFIGTRFDDNLLKIPLPDEVCKDIKEVIDKWIEIYKEQIKNI